MPQGNQGKASATQGNGADAPRTTVQDVVARFNTPTEGATITQRFSRAANTVCVPAGHVAFAPYEMSAVISDADRVEMHYNIAAGKVKKDEKEMPTNLVEADEQLRREVNSRVKNVLLLLAAQRIVDRLYAKNGITDPNEVERDKYVSDMLTLPEWADKATKSVAAEIAAILLETRTPQKRGGVKSDVLAKPSIEPGALFADL